jgi:hypothetical protein
MNEPNAKCRRCGETDDQVLWSIGDAGEHVCDECSQIDYPLCHDAEDY